MSSRSIPYTHWAYFPDEESAQNCVADLADYVTRIDRPLRERDPEYAEEFPEGGTDWLLRAARDVPVGGLVARHEEVEAIVARHGGQYDGGESGWSATGPIPDPTLDNPTDPRDVKEEGK